uniref:Uncharacterized protein n=1 Tax=Janibacter limosus TaxID=53458 RepID=A0AC61U7Q4_9MICO|nr:hypothetical protein [Janibacter limosus]
MDQQMNERQPPDDRDVDAAFEAMIAHWDEPTPDEDQPAHDRLPAPLDTPPRRPRQTTAGVHGAFPPPRPVDPQRNDVPWRVDPTNSVADALMGSDDDPGSADDDEGFQPPPPAPLPPSTDRLFWGALPGPGHGDPRPALAGHRPPLRRQLGDLPRRRLDHRRLRLPGSSASRRTATTTPPTARV